MNAKPNTGSEVCPHVCKCGSACYIGAFELECVNPLCDHYSESTLIAFQREHRKPIGGRIESIEIDGKTYPVGSDDSLIMDIGEDEPTEPRAISATLTIEPTQDDAFNQYVDAWGPMLGIPKQAGESAEDYRKRLLYVLRGVGLASHDDDDNARMVPTIYSID